MELTLIMRNYSMTLALYPGPSHTRPFLLGWEGPGYLATMTHDNFFFPQIDCGARPGEIRLPMLV